MRTLLVTALVATALVGCRQQEAAENVATAEEPAENAAAPAENAAASAPMAAAPAAPATPEEAQAAIKQREANFKQIGKAMKGISDTLKTGSPDVAVIKTSAATIADLSTKLPAWFAQGTGPDVGKSEAKPEIWTKWNEFAADAKDFEVKAAAFNAAAQGGDIAAIKAAHADLGKTCKTCHDQFQLDH